MGQKREKKESVCMSVKERERGERDGTGACSARIALLALLA